MSTSLTHPADPEIKLRFVEVNGIKMRIAEQGTGPLVLLVHGWPESWFSWRYQIPFLAKQGYHVVAPDMRGYGGTDSPQDVDAFNITHICADLLGLMDTLGAKTATLVGHDWGALITWLAAQLHPDRFPAIFALSVPHGGRQPEKPTDLWKKRYGDKFFYILYHNEPGGVAEAEYDSNPAGILSRLYYGKHSRPEDPVQPPISDPLRSAGGWIGRWIEPPGLPSWLSQAEFDYFVNEFKLAGFRGGVNYYRNFDKNWELTESLAGKKVQQPTGFAAGKGDMVLMMFGGAENSEKVTRMNVENLVQWTVVDGAGHWVQQEKPDEVNKALLAFLQSDTVKSRL
eukprot:TRINITY_DN94799_c0_g1_i1.p1 TRINITY_DN94799_c0_g1~~TRINITY_DN94799_c0_g1_i1.p1  ORF type:complete len:341 (-),score=27.94 TRINITY_DN94799_c0_g1_i1:217-1239(-)